MRLTCSIASIVAICVAQPAFAQSQTSAAVTQAMEGHLARTRAEVARYREFARVCNRAMMEVSSRTLLRYAEVGQELIETQRGQADRINPLPDFGDITAADAQRYSELFNEAAIYLPAAENCPGPAGTNYLLQAVSDGNPRNTRLDQITGIANRAIRSELGSMGAAVRCDLPFLFAYESELERDLNEAQRLLDVGRDFGGGETIEVRYGEAQVELIRRAFHAARARREECERRPRIGAGIAPVRTPRTQLPVPHAAELFGGGSFGSLELPPANYGFRRNSSTGPDLPAGAGVNRTDMIGIFGGLELPRIGRLTVSYAEGDDENRTIVAPSTAGSQGVVGVDNAPSTSTGVAASLGVNVDTGTTVRVYGMEFRHDFFGHSDFDTGGPAPERVTADNIHLYVDLAAQFRSRDLTGRASIIGTTAGGTAVQVDQRIDQGLDELELRAGLGAEAIFPVSAGVRFSICVEAGIYYYDFDLSTLETRNQNVGPASDRAYTLSLSDAVSGIAYYGDAIAAMEVDLSPRVSVFASGTVLYASERGQAVNPSSGDFVLSGGTSFLDTADSLDWIVRLGLRVRLGELNRLVPGAN